MAKPRYIVALTGGIGSGKSTVAALFGQLGVHLIDTDAIAHAITRPGGPALAPICKAFGAEALDATGALDRDLMRARVFEDAGARKTLEDILHPLIRERVELALGADSAASAPYVMLAVPLLFETTGYWKRARRALVVDCPVALQRRRVQRRSGLELAEIDRILASQLRRSLRLQLADDVIANSAEAAGLSPQVAVLHARYQALARAEG